MGLNPAQSLTTIRVITRTRILSFYLYISLSQDRPESQKPLSAFVFCLLSSISVVSSRLGSLVRQPWRFLTWKPSWVSLKIFFETFYSPCFTRRISFRFGFAFCVLRFRDWFLTPSSLLVVSIFGIFCILRVLI